jgi:hypothetical protein
VQHVAQARLHHGPYVVETVEPAAPGPGCEFAASEDGSIPLVLSETQPLVCVSGAKTWRDDRFAPEIPPMLYIGHIEVPAGINIELLCGIDTIRLSAGTYRVSRTSY